MSTDGGDTFAPTRSVAVATSEGIASVAWGAGALYVAYWADDDVARMRVSHDDGATWDPAIDLGRDGYGSQGLSVAANGSSAAAVFGGSELRYRSTADSGATWTPIRAFAETFGTVALPSRVIGSGWRTRPVIRYRDSLDGIALSVPSVAAGRGPATAIPSSVGSLRGTRLVFYMPGDGFRPVMRLGT